MPFEGSIDSLHVKFKGKGKGKGKKGLGTRMCLGLAEVELRLYPTLTPYYLPGAAFLSLLQYSSEISYLLVPAIGLFRHYVTSHSYEMEP